MGTCGKRKEGRTWKSLRRIDGISLVVVQNWYNAAVLLHYYFLIQIGPEGKKELIGIAPRPEGDNQHLFEIWRPLCRELRIKP